MKARRYSKDGSKAESRLFKRARIAPTNGVTPGAGCANYEALRPVPPRGGLALLKEHKPRNLIMAKGNNSHRKEVKKPKKEKPKPAV
jgi:hypothetical protein